MYKTMFPRVVLPGCKPWSLTPRDYRLREFENKTFREIFGPKRREVRKWRTLYNKQLHDFYSSPDIIKPMVRETKA
jgi:hypothetical protein